MNLTTEYLNRLAHDLAHVPDAVGPHEVIAALRSAARMIQENDKEDVL